MTIHRAGPAERFTAPFWLAAVSFILAVATIVTWLALGMIMEPLRRSGRFDWVAVILLPAPIVAAAIGLRYFSRYLYRHEGNLRPGLAAHLRHCALLYTGVAFVFWGWARCAATRCADDFGVGVAATALLVLGVGADAWALIQWRRVDHVGLSTSRGDGAPLPNER